MTASVDIDGVLNYYPQCWVDYVNLQLKSDYQTKEEIKRSVSKGVYDEIKSKYRGSSFKESLPVRHDAISLLRRLKSLQYKIILATSRPIDDKSFPKLRTITENWLKNNHIPYDKLLYKCESVKYLDSVGDIEFHIDDEEKFARAISEKGVRVFLYDEYGRVRFKNEDKVRVVRNFEEIYQELK